LSLEAIVLTILGIAIPALIGVVFKMFRSLAVIATQNEALLARQDAIANDVETTKESQEKATRATIYMAQLTHWTAKKNGDEPFPFPADLLG